MDCATNIIFGQTERISIIFPSTGLRSCPRSHFSTPLTRFTVFNVKKSVLKSTSATSIWHVNAIFCLCLADAKSQKMITRFQNSLLLALCRWGDERGETPAVRRLVPKTKNPKTPKPLLWCPGYFTHWQTRLTIRLADNLHCFTKYISKI